MKFSVILPVHNEEKFLPLSLPSIIALNPEEIVFLFDRCNDRSEEVVTKILASHHVTHKATFHYKITPRPSWRTRIAYLRYFGSKVARNNNVLFTSADIILDPQIRDHLKLTPEVQFISFWHNDYPVSWSSRLKRLAISTRIGGLGKSRFLGGSHFFDRRIAFKLENVESLMKIESAEDTHLLMAINTRYKTKCVVVNSIHLRPRGKERDRLCGRLAWSISHRSFHVTIIKALCLLQPLQIKGYIHERWGLPK